MEQPGTPATINLSNPPRPADQTIVNNGGTVIENVCPAITLSPPSLPASRVNVPYNQTITASGGTEPYSFAVTSGSLPGGLSLSSTGTLSGTPSASGTFNFTVTATDANSCTGVLGYSLTVNANNAPDAVDDAAATDEDTAVTVSVLANDTDADGDALSVSSATVPANGNIAINPDGTITYTPNTNFNGTDSFGYTVGDGHGGSDTATVAVTVAAVNDAPDATDDGATTAEDTAANIAVLGNDTDIDGNTLAVSSVTQGANGAVIVNANGTLTYTPNANFNGSDSFTYTVSDGAGGSDTATVSVTITAVNDAPVATNNSYSTNEDAALNVAAPGVLGDDNDVDSTSLSAALVSGPANGSLQLNADGSFTYTPNANFSGADGFSYKASDGAADSGAATVTITVNAVNDAPDAADDTATTAEDTAVNVSVLGNDADIEGDTLSVTAVTQGANGVVVINGDGTVTYTPNANFNGADTFTYTVSDGNGGGDTAAVSVTITAMNDAPTATGDGFSTDEDTPLAVAAPGVKANDADVDGDALTALLVSGPASGTLNFNPDGSFSYAPAANFFGTVSFTYKVNDGAADSGTATVMIEVNAVNDAPDAANDAAATDQNVAVSVAVLANDTDVDGHALIVSAITQGANGSVTINANGTVTYTPNADFSGTDTFAYTASDGHGGSGTATVTVVVNPVITASNLTVSAPAFIANGGSVALSGVLTGRANAPLAGRTVTLSIGSGAATQSCTATTTATGVASCTITGVNQPLGPGLPVRSSFAGDGGHFPSSAATTALVFAYAAGAGGGFVIGDRSAEVGAAVTFWGAQWARENSLSGGDAPNGFKGFANRGTSQPVTCGSTWFTDPGNSSDPPASVPSYTAVIVSSRITKSGATISGDAPQVVIVRTNAGYSANPGHAGTGTVVGVLCP